MKNYPTEQDLINTYSYMFEYMNSHKVPPTIIELIHWHWINFYRYISWWINPKNLYSMYKNRNKNITYWRRPRNIFIKFYRIQQPIAYGISCGEGWFPLLEMLLKLISEVDVDKKVRILQIKEKFGSLRFYIEGGNDKIHELISNAEEASFNICEVCGASPATQTKTEWIKTLCTEHMRDKNDRGNTED